MSINVNRVVVGVNYSDRNVAYTRSARGPVGGTLPDGSSLICKAGGLAWFVSPRSTELLTTRVAGGETNSINCAVAVTGVSGWFVPTSAQLNNPGYLCRVNWVTCTPGVGVSTNYSTSCCYASTTLICQCVYKAPANCFQVVQSFANGTVVCLCCTDTTPLRYRTFRCITY
jgi:hypothetical protein